jgi:hypothetical protein
MDVFVDDCEEEREKRIERGRALLLLCAAEGTKGLI